jgi:hypothetical protein
LEALQQLLELAVAGPQLYGSLALPVLELVHQAKVGARLAHWDALVLLEGAAYELEQLLHEGLSSQALEVSFWQEFKISLIIKEVPGGSATQPAGYCSQ